MVNYSGCDLVYRLDIGFGIFAKPGIFVVTGCIKANAQVRESVQIRVFTDEEAAIIGAATRVEKLLAQIAV